MEEIRNPTQCLEWWKSLDMSERARIVVPLVQIQMANKPQKLAWDCELEELERLFLLLRWGLMNKRTVDK